MKLYYSPGACSLSPHIVLHEAGLPHEVEKVDLKAKQTEKGTDYWTVNAKGSVPALEIDGEVLTEGPAIVQYIADRAPAKKLAPANGTFARSRLQEMLNFITSDLHKGFSPLFNPSMPEEAKAMARELLKRKFTFLDGVMEKNGGPYIFGPDFCVADAYLFTVCRWAPGQGIDLAAYPSVTRQNEAMKARPAVQEAMKMEGLKVA